MSIPFAAALRRLYAVRFVFAIAWAAVVLAAAPTGAFLTILLVIYPLFDAGSVLWQLRAAPARSSASEWINVAVSVAVAVALGVASTVSIPAVLVVWGIWAIGSGIPQLVTAIRNRASGGQVAQMLSGGISVFAGAGFVLQGIQGASSVAGPAGYAAIGGIFFLVSAIRLSVLLRRTAA
ncbi:hypothetical protein [Microbacterium indicum]|uniref:hypothetical protein n=1 Tax=Microbacterium indicum TaxID=358100 RepID=UPI00040B11C0|nr:hypothetical protein [Microbacterium indicum]